MGRDRGSPPYGSEQRRQHRRIGQHEHAAGIEQHGVESSTWDRHRLRRYRPIPLGTMGVLRWIFGKHPPRPPDPDRTCEAAWLPMWQAQLVLHELWEADIPAVMSEDFTSHMRFVAREPMARHLRHRAPSGGGQRSDRARHLASHAAHQGIVDRRARCDRDQAVSGRARLRQRRGRALHQSDRAARSSCARSCIVRVAESLPRR